MSLCRGQTCSFFWFGTSWEGSQISIRISIISTAKAGRGVKMIGKNSIYTPLTLHRDTKSESCLFILQMTFYLINNYLICTPHDVHVYKMYYLLTYHRTTIHQRTFICLYSLLGCPYFYPLYFLLLVCILQVSQLCFTSCT